MEEFKIRAYSKEELAILYFPTAASPHAAVNHLMSWIIVPFVFRLTNIAHRLLMKSFS